MVFDICKFGDPGSNPNSFPSCGKSLSSSKHLLPQWSKEEKINRAIFRGCLQSAQPHVWHRAAQVWASKDGSC